MRRAMHCLMTCVVVGFTPSARADGPPLAEYFRVETAKLSARPLGGIESAEAWKKARPELQRQLREMLGLDPLPERTDLHATITGTVERPDFVVETLHYQSRPGLYVTANLYRPKEVKHALPAILYVCGHAKEEKDGVIFGNKAHYQHHAAWYAANGYVCLIVDTLQLGELPGLHHGTYREGMWWWQSRGYTPAGVEAWNGIRGIDYLISRPEVDKTKIGVTGRSGGGATSWWLAALDDRIAAVIPVAGITDLKNHVVDGNNKQYPNGVVEGHCDCMYFVNTYRWDFPLLAALAAPKAMLVENTDQDPIFPEDGVRRVYEQVKKVYEWYDASDKLDLVIGKGGHVDSEEVRHPSFAFMNKWLRKVDEPIVEPDRKIPVELLKVLKPGEVPADNKNDTIHESFVAKAKEPPTPKSAEEWARLKARWLEEAKAKVFAGWPMDSGLLGIERQARIDPVGLPLEPVEFTSQAGVRLRLWRTIPEGGAKPTAIRLGVFGEDQGEAFRRFLGATSKEGRDRADSGQSLGRKLFPPPGELLVYFAPRGVGPAAWPTAKDTHVRRRFALLGQTLDGMRAWDVRRALAVVRELDGAAKTPIHLVGVEGGAPLALWAAAFEPGLAEVTLMHPPDAVHGGPAFLNLGRTLDMPQAAALLHPRPTTIVTKDPSAWRWATDLGNRLGRDGGWPTIEVEAVTAPAP